MLLFGYKYNYIMNMCYIFDLCSDYLSKIVLKAKGLSLLIHSNIESVEIYINILSELVTLAILIWGCFVIKRIKDKKIEATTDFYSKFKVHLIHIKRHLGTEHYTVLSYLYDNTILINVDILKPSNCVDFLNTINGLLDFLKNSDNQVIPSKKFFDNLNGLTDLLAKYSLLPDYHPFSDYNNNEPVKKELKEINGIIDELISEIESEQKTLHQKLWKEKKP